MARFARRRAAGDNTGGESGGKGEPLLPGNTALLRGGIREREPAGDGPVNRTPGPADGTGGSISRRSPHHRGYREAPRSRPHRRFRTGVARLARRRAAGDNPGGNRGGPLLPGSTGVLSEGRIYRDPAGGGPGARPRKAGDGAGGMHPPPVVSPSRGGWPSRRSSPHRPGRGAAWPRRSASPGRSRGRRRSADGAAVDLRPPRERVARQAIGIVRVGDQSQAGQLGAALAMLPGRVPGRVERSQAGSMIMEHMKNLI